MWSKINESLLKDKFGEIFKISAKDNIGIDELKEKLYNMVIDSTALGSQVMLTNARHIHIVEQALNLTNKAIEAINMGVTIDLLDLDIKNIWLKLGEITGESNTEQIIDEIFMKFCLGK